MIVTNADDFRNFVYCGQLYFSKKYYWLHDEKTIKGVLTTKHFTYRYVSEKCTIDFDTGETYEGSPPRV